jgi:hypothetical protein
MSKLIVAELGGIPQTLDKITVPAGHILKTEGDVIHAGNDYFQLPTGTTADRPGSPGVGYLRFNTTTNVPEYYDGSAWSEITSEVGTQASPATSPLAILAANPQAADGIYYFDHGQGSYQAYADMKSGGYLLVGKISNSPADTSNPWSYTGTRWNQQTTTNETQCQNVNSGDALNRGYYQYTSIDGFAMAMSSPTNFLRVSRPGVTARTAFTTRFDTSLGRWQWLDWMEQEYSQWDNQPNCNREGFARTDSSGAAMRFGITFNNEGDCNSNDSSVGFGVYTNSQSGSGSHNAACGGHRWNPDARYAKNGWIFVR